MAISIAINGAERTVDVDPEMPLLWLLRDVLGMTGTKYDCGIAQCGACTVHLDGKAVRSCLLSVGKTEPLLCKCASRPDSSVKRRYDK